MSRHELPPPVVQSFPLEGQAHTPATQPAVAPVQTLPQSPQLPGSELTSRQTPPHNFVPVPQTQTPDTQSAVGPQSFPQPPQFLGSLEASTQELPHKIVGLGQAPSTGSGESGRVESVVGESAEVAESVLVPSPPLEVSLLPVSSSGGTISPADPPHATIETESANAPRDRR